MPGIKIDGFVWGVFMLFLLSTGKVDRYFLPKIICFFLCDSLLPGWEGGVHLMWVWVWIGVGVQFV